MADVTKDTPLEFSKEQIDRLLTPPPPGPIPAPTVVIFYVYEEPDGNLYYTGFSLTPEYTFLESMFKRNVRYTVRVAVKNIVTGVEELCPNELTLVGGESLKVAPELGFHWPIPTKKSTLPYRQ